MQLPWWETCSPGTGKVFSCFQISKRDDRVRVGEREVGGGGGRGRIDGKRHPLGPGIGDMPLSPTLPPPKKPEILET